MKHVHQFVTRLSSEMAVNAPAAFYPARVAAAATGAVALWRESAQPALHQDAAGDACGFPSRDRTQKGVRLSGTVRTGQADPARLPWYEQSALPPVRHGDAVRRVFTSGGLACETAAAAIVVAPVGEGNGDLYATAIRHLRVAMIAVWQRDLPLEVADPSEHADFTGLVMLGPCDRESDRLPLARELERLFARAQFHLPVGGRQWFDFHHDPIILKTKATYATRFAVLHLPACQ